MVRYISHTGCMHGTGSFEVPNCHLKILDMVPKRFPYPQLFIWSYLVKFYLLFDLLVGIPWLLLCFLLLSSGDLMSLCLHCLFDELALCLLGVLSLSSRTGDLDLFNLDLDSCWQCLQCILCLSDHWQSESCALMLLGVFFSLQLHCVQS